MKIFFRECFSKPWQLCVGFSSFLWPYILNVFTWNIVFECMFCLFTSPSDITEGEERWCRGRWKRQRRCWCCDVCGSYLSVQQCHGFLADTRLDSWRSRGSHGGRAQRPGGAGAVCPHLQTTTHQAGIHPGKKHRDKRKVDKSVCVSLSSISDTVYLSLSGRRWRGYGQTVRQWLQPDHHLPIWSTQPEL